MSSQVPSPRRTLGLHGPLQGLGGLVVEMCLFQETDTGHVTTVTSVSDLAGAPLDIQSLPPVHRRGSWKVQEEIKQPAKITQLIQRQAERQANRLEPAQAGGYQNYITVT